ncbi:hypothetical protein QAD02_002121 [Eretmocerus hayati]|uniref:Uncharacterized protein n=1 Tax=Eretmocerus hayati TaxID=131215 RepID=A0ACC2NID2_9HYME|nr:hypothetical protein QAD02_002121 [Eretmocerus hayati]
MCFAFSRSLVLIFTRNEMLHIFTAISLASQKICGNHFEPGDIKVNPVTQKSCLLPNKRPIHWRDAQMRARENEAARRHEYQDREAASHENDLHVVTPPPVSYDDSISQCESILPDATVHCTPPSSNPPVRPSRDQSPEQPLDDQQFVIESSQGAIPDPLSAFDQFILRERVPDNNDIPLEVNRSSCPVTYRSGRELMVISSESQNDEACFLHEPDTNIHKEDVTTPTQPQPGRQCVYRHETYMTLIYHLRDRIVRLSAELEDAHHLLKEKDSEINSLKKTIKNAEAREQRAKVWEDKFKSSRVNGQVNEIIEAEVQSPTATTLVLLQFKHNIKEYIRDEQNLAKQIYFQSA